MTNEPLHKKYLLEQRQKLRETHDQGEAGLTVAGRHAAFIDVFIISVFNSVEVRALLGLEGAEQACVVLGLGGYGRKELAPFSDIDLLFLYSEKIESQVEEVIRKILYPLWDVGYELGYTVQTLEHCLEMARSDPSFLTALLDARRVTGSTSLAQSLKARINALLKDGQRSTLAGLDPERRGKAPPALWGFGFFPGAASEGRLRGIAGHPSPALDGEIPF